MLVLDHIAVLGETLAQAAHHAQSALGVPLGAGGRHALFATHNRLIGLDDGLYLEAIARDPEAKPPKRARWFGLDGFQGPARLDKWICRVADLDAVLQRLPMAGERVEVTRGDLAWAMAVPADGCLPFDGLFPALIQWHGDQHPSARLASAGLGLSRLTVAHPEAMRLKAVLGDLLSDERVRFDISDTPRLTAELKKGAELRCLR